MHARTANWLKWVLSASKFLPTNTCDKTSSPSSFSPSSSFTTTQTMAVSLLHVLLATLVGLYVGINLSSLHLQQQPAVPSHQNHDRRYDQQQQTNRQTSTVAFDDVEVKRWKAQVEKLQTDYTASLNKIHELEESYSLYHDNQSSSLPSAQHASLLSSSSSLSLPFTNPHPICKHVLPHPAPTATAMWNEHLLRILEASRLPNDTKFQFHDFTVQLLQIISPRLMRSVKTTTTDWRPVERALTVAWERYQYLQLPQNERRAVKSPPRPLKVLIMGGSLLVGTNCRARLTELDLKFRLPKRECTWANRVGQFINSFFGFPSSPRQQDFLLDVTKVAMGGTNTATGSVIWQYDLVPEEARNPDIVLNAYSTNDMHILTVLEAESSNITLRDRTFDMLQNFVRQVLSTTSCPVSNADDGETSSGGSNTATESIPPVLLHMDDYLGNEQRKIWDTTTMFQGVQVLASYYGFASMSYADVVRDLVYADTYETWFSSEWWKPPEWMRKRKKVNIKETDLVFDREIHPGMGMHIASTWVVAYNLLHLTTSFCSLPTPGRPQDLAKYEPNLWGLPILKNDVPQAKNKPRSQIPPNILPPVLTKELLLEDVTSLWQKEVEVQKALQEQHHSLICKKTDDSSDEHSATIVKCPFSWVSNLSLQQNNKTWISEYFKDQSSVWHGWQLSDDGDKIGFVPSDITASSHHDVRMVLDFRFPHQAIRSVTIFFMKSYGDKWRNSELSARVLLNPAADINQDSASSHLVVSQERTILGTHAKNTSEMYTEEVILEDPIEPGNLLQFEARLVGGEMFKIMGLAVCS